LVKYENINCWRICVAYGKFIPRVAVT